MGEEGGGEGIDGEGRVMADNFRMNTDYGRYSAAYNMVVLIANFCVFE